MARTLTCGRRETVPAEVLNPTAEDVYLYKAMQVTVASPFLVVAEKKHSEQDLPEAGLAERLMSKDASKVPSDSVEEMVQEAMGTQGDTRPMKQRASTLPLLMREEASKQVAHGESQSH